MLSCDGMAKHEWAKRNKLKAPIDDGLFIDTNPKRYKCDESFNFIDTGLYVCSMQINIICFFSDKTRQRCSIINLNEFLNSSVTPSKLYVLREQILCLLKELHKIQTRSMTNPIEDKSSNNYVEMKNIVSNSGGCQPYMNRITTIEKYRKVQKFLEALDFEGIDKLTTVTKILFNTTFGKEDIFTADKTFSPVINDK